MEGDTVAHEAELTVTRGEPVWNAGENIPESVRAEAAKPIPVNGNVTSSPPPAHVGVVSSSRGKKVAIDETPGAGFVEDGRKDTRGRKANRKRRNPAISQTGTAAPPPVPVGVQAPTPLTGVARYGWVTAAPPPSPVPHITRPGSQVRSRLVPSLPPAPVRPGPSGARVPTASPSPNACKRHITMRFDAGTRTHLPVTPEAIRIRMNQSLSNLGKVSDKTRIFGKPDPSLKLGAFT